MKTILYFIAAFTFCSFLAPKGEKQNVTVILHLDEELSQTEQTLYIASFCSWISGYEQNIWDSIQVRKGQKSVMLHAYAPPRGNFFRIIFSKEGPNELGIYANSNETIEMAVKHTDIARRIVYKKALRGQYHNDWMEYYHAERELLKKKRSFEMEKNTDSITRINNEIVEFYYEYFNHAKHFAIANSCVNMLRALFSDLLSKDSLQALRQQFAETYPDDPRAALDHGYNKKQTARGIHVAQRLGEISMARTNYERSKQYTQIGRTLNLNLCDMDGKRIAVSDLAKQHQYVYVDIWASWCKPCRVQFSYIKTALDKYPQDLKVYAISIDQNHKVWEKAITKEPLKSFINVVGTDNDWKLLKEVKDLGVERIPRSFLLDKNCKIIAKDLHDGKLIEVLDSLLQK